MARITAEQKARTREDVFEAARAEFEQLGFEGASLRAIAKRAGVATGTLFNYADGKLGLLHAIFHEDLEPLVRSTKSVARSTPVIEQIVSIFGLFFDHYASRPDLSRVFLKESLFSDPDAPVSFRDQAQIVADEIQARVIEHFSQRCSTSTISPQLVTLSAVSVYYFALISGLSGGTPNPQQQRSLVRAQLTGLLEDR